jgi:hypothetical protein
MMRIWMWIPPQIRTRRQGVNGNMRGRGGCLDAREGEESCTIEGAEGGEEGWGMSCR